VSKYTYSPELTEKTPMGHTFLEPDQDSGPSTMTADQLDVGQWFVDDDGDLALRDVNSVLLMTRARPFKRWSSLVDIEVRRVLPEGTKINLMFVV